MAGETIREISSFTTSHVPPPPLVSGDVQTPQGEGLTQGQRLVNTFIAPSATFMDIRRRASWWLPFLIGVVITYGWVFAIQSKVGWPEVVENTLRQGSPAQQEKLSTLQPAQQVQQKKFMQLSFQTSFYSAPVLSFVSFLVIASVLWLTINFAAGGRATFWKVFAVITYAWLPQMFKPLLSIVTLFASNNPEDFNLSNPVGTNLGYFLAQDSAAWLRALGGSLDIFVLWSLVLLAIGVAIVAQVKRSSGYMVVFGWWLVIVLVKTGFAAFTG